MIKEVTAAEFKESYGTGLVLGEFFSSTCGPCKMLSFILKDVEKQYGDELSILQVNFEQNPDLCQEFNVAGYPTMIFFKDGVEKERTSGLQQKTAIFKVVDGLK